METWSPKLQVIRDGWCWVRLEVFAAETWSWWEWEPEGIHGEAAVIRGRARVRQ